MGDYYYYKNGKWVFVKNSTENPDTPDPTPTPTWSNSNTRRAVIQAIKPQINQSTHQNHFPHQKITGNFDFQKNPPFVGADGEFDPSPTPENPSEPKPEEPVQPEVPGNDGLVSLEST